MLPVIINLLYPAQCRACGEKTSSWDQHICENCQKRIKRRLPPFCVKCGKQISGDPQIQNMCTDCKKEKIYFDHALSVFHYDGVLKELVHDFKYKKVTSLAAGFADLVVDFMKEYSMAKDTDIILSIPMHPWRLFKREVNASDILAKNIAKRLGRRYSTKILKKIKNTPPQSKLPRSERINNIKYSFSIHKNKETEIKDKNILLVDDLLTTGSTVNECARLLKGASSGRIEVITLARGDRLP